MIRQTLSGVGCMLAAMLIGLSHASAAGKAAAPEVPLTESGQKLLARYSDRLTALQAEVAKALPSIDEQQKAAFLNAYQDEAAATAAELKAMRAQDGKGAKDKEAPAKAYSAAKEALALAATNALAPTRATLKQLAPFLASDKLDAQLVKCVVLAQATPRGLAAR